MNACEAAREYLEKGLRPVPVPSGKKGPRRREWQSLRVTEKEIDELFQKDGNIGLLTGEPSNGLIDIDLDCPLAVQLAPVFLPPTSMRSGRPSRPSSHLWYRVSDTLPSTKKYTADTRVLVELRASGCQTLVAPSTHPDGDVYAWEGELEPSEIEGNQLRNAVAKLAAATLLASHWPGRGSRHDAANALAGMLLRAGWIEADVVEFVRHIAIAAGDEEADDRANAAAATARTLSTGQPATGSRRWPKPSARRSLSG